MSTSGRPAIASPLQWRCPRQAVSEISHPCMLFKETRQRAHLAADVILADGPARYHDDPRMRAATCQKGPMQMNEVSHVVCNDCPSSARGFYQQQLIREIPDGPWLFLKGNDIMPLLSKAPSQCRGEMVVQPEPEHSQPAWSFSFRKPSISSLWASPYATAISISRRSSPG